MPQAGAGSPDRRSGQHACSSSFDLADRVRLGPLLAWGGVGLPVAALGLPLVVYLPPHYAGTLGLPLATVGFIFAVVRLVDIPLDPLIGALMDNSRSRFGQFRPWLVAGAAMLMLGAFLTFMARPGVSAPMAFVSLLVLYLGFSMTTLAQVSWGSRLSGDYRERARIFGFWTACNVFGTLTVLFIPPLVARSVPGADSTAGIVAMGWFIIALAPFTALTAALTVPEGEAPATDHKVRWADLRAVLADRRMVQLLAVDLLISLAPGITGALFLFFFTAARDVPAATASTLLLGYFIAGLAAAPVWVRLARGWGKHKATALAAIWFAASQLGLLAMPAGNLPLLGAGMVVAGVPFAAPVFLLRAMMADLNDAQALGRRRREVAGAETIGLNFAILTATQKLGYAIPVGLTYPLLALIGFDPAPGAANDSTATLALEILFAGPSALLAVVGAALIWRWPITAEMHAEIRAGLDAA